MANVTWQDDLETVRDSLVSPDGLCLVCGMADHRENCQHPDAAPSLARLEARLEQADKLARAVRAYCGTSHADCAPKDPDDEFDLGCSLQPLSAALADWDGDTA